MNLEAPGSMPGAFCWPRPQPGCCNAQKFCPAPELSPRALSTSTQNFLLTFIEATMDDLSYLGIGFAVVIFGLACLMALKLSSKTAYH
jgi:hypothetical protein